jgi:hypothetical protein
MENWVASSGKHHLSAGYKKNAQLGGISQIFFICKKYDLAQKNRKRYILDNYFLIIISFSKGINCVANRLFQPHLYIFFKKPHFRYGK